MTARLPSRPTPTFRPGAGRLRRGRIGGLGDGAPGDPTGAGRARRGPLYRRPLALIFRRPARALPAPVMRSRDGAAVRLSLSLSLRLWLAERLTTLVREVAPASPVGRERRTGAAGDGPRAPAAAATQRAWRLGATSYSGQGRTSRRPLRTLGRDAVQASSAAHRDRLGRTERNGSLDTETALTRRPAWRTPPSADGDGLGGPTGSRPATRPTSQGGAAELPTATAPGTTPRHRHRRLGAAGEPLTDRLANPATAAPVPARRRLRRPTGPAGPHPGGYPATDLRATGPRLRAVVHRPAPAPPAPGPLAVPDRPPAPLVHRNLPAVVDAPVVAVPPPPAPQAAPAVDLDRLDRELWHRFEKRMRIERERRGRG